MKIFGKLFLPICIILTVLLCSCSKDTPAKPEADGDGKYTVQLVFNDREGVVADVTRLTVNSGEDAVFDIALSPTYGFADTSHGTYDEALSRLTVKNVTSDLRVSFKVTPLGYDRRQSIFVMLSGTELDSSDLGEGAVPVNLGSSATFTAGDTTRRFVGWTLGGPLSPSCPAISKDRVFTLFITPDNVDAYTVGNGKDRFLTVFPNYIDANILKYDPNGGNVNTESVNMLGNAYYMASYSGGKVTVTLSDTYMDYASSASTFWDDGTFYRPGYVLTEYNTMPDGSGEGYSLGSKFYAPSTEDQTLYCIWSEATPESNFEYEDVKWGFPSGVTSEKAPWWVTDGVKITRYKGDAETVVIPETIGGKTVTTIDTGAFTDKKLKTLVFSRFVLRVEDGAFVGCSSLSRIYVNDSIYYMNDAALDAESYASLKDFYLNATMAPRYTTNVLGDGSVFGVKMSRLLESYDKNRVIIVSGSSTYQGFTSPYFEALMDGEYTVVNLGLTRTFTGMIVFEALSHYTHEGDIVIYAPENHVNIFGNNTMWYRSFYDVEGMYNFFRYIDISHYPSAFSALSAYNRERRYTRAPGAYEDAADPDSRIDAYGEYQYVNRQYYCGEAPGQQYNDSYFITLNRYFKNDDRWDEEEHLDYNTSPTWTDVSVYKDEINRAIGKIRDTGAEVYFGFAPVDANSVASEARCAEWLSAYGDFMLETFDFDGAIGTMANYVYNHKYIFDSAYHVNDYGRTYRTYQMYVDVCRALGITDVKGIYDVGTDFEGCLFEEGSDGTPLTPVEWLSN